ncbi:UDP-glycosyltransferase 87A1-like [Prosopis cineraria]|uniref:UDP-glycosyltransferase 87A1-like n=1 Tax=Prosopis cineraria TaxID=364024 RepID=UPI00240F2334|nr:UDP-glycosyltransferase 87A1-like [Prosopis cineraria]
MSMEVADCVKGHVVALPFPTRSLVNPMINLCKFLSSRTPDDLIITFVVTQEWLGFIRSYPKPHTIRVATIPDVMPPDGQTAHDVPGFVEAIATVMRPTFEQLLNQLEPPVTAIVADANLVWPAAVANLRNIPVALLWTMSASSFETYRQLDMLAPGPDRRLSVHLLDEQADEQIQRISSLQLTDLRKLLYESDLRFLKMSLDCIPGLAKTDCLLLNSIQELEAEHIDYLKAIFPFRLYAIGPAIPFMELEPPRDSSTANSDHIIKWLDSQPETSVLYISMGSFLSMSRPQMEELASALKSSGIRFLWVGRSDVKWLREKCGDKGLVVPWCDQLKVLCHVSIAGFWSHCGWNSTLEACFAGVPILGFPIFLDQFSNCRHVAEEWKNGWKVGGERSENFVTKGEILKVLKMVMEVESEEGKKIREKAKELKALFRGAISKGGSSDMNMEAFVKDMI